VESVGREHIIRRDDRDDRRILRRALPASSNEPVPVGTVAAIRYGPDGPPIAAISRANATIAVLEKCVCGASRPADAFNSAVRITSTSQTPRGSRVDAAWGLEQMIAMLGDG